MNEIIKREKEKKGQNLCLTSPPQWSERLPLPSFLASPRPPTLSRVARLDLAARQCPQLLVTYNFAGLLTSSH